MTKGVGEKKPGDATHPKQAPVVVAAQSQVNVKRGASVFAFFAGMPEPEVFQAWLGVVKKPGVGQQPVGQQGGEMFSGCRRGHGVSDVKALDVGNAFGGAFFPVIDHALGQQMLVVEVVQTAVGGFLAHKGFDVISMCVLQFRWQLFEAFANRIQKKLFAHGKTQRKGVHERRTERIATVPAQGKRLVQVDVKLADDGCRRHC